MTGISLEVAYSFIAGTNPIIDNTGCGGRNSALMCSRSVPDAANVQAEVGRRRDSGDSGLMYCSATPALVGSGRSISERDGMGSTLILSQSWGPALSDRGAAAGFRPSDVDRSQYVDVAVAGARFSASSLAAASRQRAQLLAGCHPASRQTRHERGGCRRVGEQIPLGAARHPRAGLLKQLVPRFGQGAFAVRSEFVIDGAMSRLMPLRRTLGSYWKQQECSARPEQPADDRPSRPARRASHRTLAAGIQRCDQDEGVAGSVVALERRHRVVHRR